MFKPVKPEAPAEQKGEEESGEQMKTMANPKEKEQLSWVGISRESFMGKRMKVEPRVNYA